jgi:hypothetical protein
VRTVAWLALPGFALVLLAAHLLHAGLTLLAAASLFLIGLLFVRRPWAARVLQLVLAVAAIEWIRTTIGLAQMRISHGQPYLRLALILGTVTVFTVLAAAAFQFPLLRGRFGLGSSRGLGSRAG